MAFLNARFTLPSASDLLIWRPMRPAASSGLLSGSDSGSDGDSFNRCGSTANWPLHMLSKVRFDEHAGKGKGKGKGTLVTIEVSAFEPAAAEQAAFDANHESVQCGWAGTLDVLEAHLARQAP